MEIKCSAHRLWLLAVSEQKGWPAAASVVLAEDPFLLTWAESFPRHTLPTGKDAVGWKVAGEAAPKRHPVVNQ